MGLKVGLLPSKDPDNPVFITYSIFDHVFTVCQFWVYCSCSFEFDNLWFFRVRVRSCSIILEKSVFVRVRPSVRSIPVRVRSSLIRNWNVSNLRSNILELVLMNLVKLLALRLLNHWKRCGMILTLTMLTMKKNLKMH